MVFLFFLVLANMLMKSGINPFDSQEAKPYKNDNEIVAMTNLVTAYQVTLSYSIYRENFQLKSISEQRHQWVWEDPEGEQRNDHGGRFHQRAHRRLAQEHQNSGNSGPHLERVLISTQVLIKLIKPYTRIQIKFISGELNIESGDVESLLVSCILDNTISGRIDQVSFG